MRVERMQSQVTIVAHAKYICPSATSGTAPFVSFRFSPLLSPPSTSQLWSFRIQGWRFLTFLSIAGAISFAQLADLPLSPLLSNVYHTVR